MDQEGAWPISQLQMGGASRPMAGKPSLFHHATNQLGALAVFNCPVRTRGIASWGYYEKETSFLGTTRYTVPVNSDSGGESLDALIRTATIVALARTPSTYGEECRLAY
ncbi:hypothetical protein MKZ38_009187 [Zalerion maritima]|uniref:Uncharacterized protein n=1 Tax=Zalerion maritima TaxID=339359 RepID=A0AAD5RVA8_9PEZI|nr:hypothetical protein MKZ38_009187 [Zalerion maritima]